MQISSLFLCLSFPPTYLRHHSVGAGLLFVPEDDVGIAVFDEILEPFVGSAEGSLGKAGGAERIFGDVGDVLTVDEGRFLAVPPRTGAPPSGSAAFGRVEHHFLAQQEQQQQRRKFTRREKPRQRRPTGHQVGNSGGRVSGRRRRRRRRRRSGSYRGGKGNAARSMMNRRRGGGGWGCSGSGGGGRRSSSVFLIGVTLGKERRGGQCRNGTSVSVFSFFIDIAWGHRRNGDDSRIVH